MNSVVSLQAHLHLCHAALQAAALETNSRILHIKGVALHPTLAKGRPSSSDCDVLVSPKDLGRYLKSLTSHGWTLYTRFEHGSVFQHAATYYHEAWGTVDVHRAFPGMDFEAQETFDLLWVDHEVVKLGNWECPVPSLDGQRLLLLLHAARDQMGKAVHDVKVAWTDTSDHDKRTIRELAKKAHAEVALAAGVGELELMHGRPGYILWKAVSTGANPTDIWIARIKDAQTLKRKMQICWSALHVNPDHLALRLGHQPSSAELRHEWWARWVRAVKNLRIS